MFVNKAVNYLTNTENLLVIALYLTIACWVLSVIAIIMWLFLLSPFFFINFILPPLLLVIVIILTGGMKNNKMQQITEKEWIKDGRI